MFSVFLQCFLQISTSFCVFALDLEPSTSMRVLRLEISSASLWRARVVSQIVFDTCNVQELSCCDSIS